MMIGFKRKLIMILLTSIAASTISGLIVACANTKNLKKGQQQKENQNLNKKQESKSIEQTSTISPIHLKSKTPILKTGFNPSLVKTNNQYTMIVYFNNDSNKFLELVLKERDSNKLIKSINKSVVTNKKATFIFSNLDIDKSYSLDGFFIYASETDLNPQHESLNQNLKDQIINISTKPTNTNNIQTKALDSNELKTKAFSLNRDLAEWLVSSRTLKGFINNLNENERLVSKQPNQTILTYLINIKDQLDTLYSSLKLKNEQTYDQLTKPLFNKYNLTKSDKILNWETIASFFDDLIKIETELAKLNSNLQKQEQSKILSNKLNNKIKIFKLTINEHNKLEAILVGSVDNVIKMLEKKQLVFKFKFPGEDKGTGLNTVDISNIRIFINQDPVDVKVEGSEVLTKNGEYIITHLYIKEPNKEVSNIDEANLLASPYKITK